MLFLIGSAFFIFLFIYPLAIYPVILILINKIYHRNDINSGVVSFDHIDRIGVCVCLYNEELIAENLIKNLISLRKMEPNLEILVHVDLSTDRTSSIISGFANEIDVLIIAKERTGKTEGMNKLVLQANSEILCFTDASVLIDSSSFTVLRRLFSDPQIGAVCGSQNFVNTEGSISAISNSVYWRLEESIKLNESQLGSIVTLDGSLYALRKSLRVAPPADIVDDFFIPFMIMQQGYRVIQSSAVKSYEPAVTDDHEEFSRKVRISCQGFYAFLKMRTIIFSLPLQDVFMFVSHKLLRWFGVYFLILSYVLFSIYLDSEFGMYTALGLQALTLIAFVLGFYGKVTPFRQVCNILTAFFGAGLGVWKVFCGSNYKTWEPPQSARKI